MTGCPHHRGRPCPIPGCPAGVEGQRLVVCGVDGAKYFERGFVVRAGAVVVAWVDAEEQQRIDEEAAA